MTQRTKSARKLPPRKADVSAALALDWQTVSFQHGKSDLADAIDVDPKTVNRAITGETLPEAHKMLASLLVDPTALKNTLALYGFRAVPIHSEAANDLNTLAELSGLVTAFIKVLEDGRRDHVETLDLALLIAPLIAKLSAIVDEARGIQGLAA